MLHREIGVGQRLAAALAHHLGGRAQLHRLERVSRLRLRRFVRFLRVNSLEHLGDLDPLLPRHFPEHVSIEVHSAALVLGVGKNLLERLEQPQRLVACDEPHARQPAPAQPQEELLPRFLRLGET